MTEADYLEAVAPLLDRGASEADVEANGRAFCETARKYGAAATMAEQVASLQDVIGLSDVEATRVASAMLVRFCPDLAD